MTKPRVQSIAVGMFIVGALFAAIFAFNELKAAAPYSATFLIGKPTYESNDDGVNDIGFLGPTNAVVDSVGHRLFVSDTEMQRVLVYNLSSPSNDFVDRRADNVLGLPSLFDASNGGDPPAQSNFYGPMGLAVDGDNGRLFVADAYNCRVMVFDISGAIADGQDAMNVLGEPDFTTNDCSTNDTSTSTVYDVAYDAVFNRLYVADGGNNRVMVFNVNPLTIFDGEPATAVIGQADFLSAGSGFANDQLSSPISLVVDGTNNRLFVGDQGNFRVQMFPIAALASVSNAATTAIGATDANSVGGGGTTGQQFYWPGGLVYDEVGEDLFVSDRYANRVLRFPASPGFADNPTQDAVIGQLDDVSSDVGDADDDLNQPLGLAFDSDSDSLYVVDAGNYRVLHYVVTAIPSSKGAADEEYGQGAASGPALFRGSQNNIPNGSVATALADPFDIVVDRAHDRMFVVDSAYNRVLVIHLDVDGLPDQDSIMNVLGQSDFYSADEATTPEGLHRPYTMTYDETGQRLFVGDGYNGRVVVYDVTSISDGMAAVNVLGAPDLNTPGGCGTTIACFYLPSGLAYNPTTNMLFVSDIAGNRVLIFDVTPGFLDGEDAVAVLGQPDFVSDGTYPISATSIDINGSGYGGMALDDAGQRLFLADSQRRRTLVFNVTSVTNNEQAIAVIGAPNFTTSGGGTTDSLTSFPFGSAYDSAQNVLYIVDTGNNRVLAFNAAGALSNGQSAMDVIGQPDFTSGGTSNPPTQESLRTPVRAAFDATAGRLWVSDNRYGRVLAFLGIPGGPAPTPTPSSGNNQTGSFINPSLLPTAVPSGTPVPGLTPVYTPDPAGSVILADGAATTKTRFVKVSYDHPFIDSVGVSTRTVNADGLAPTDRELLYEQRYRQPLTAPASDAQSGATAPLQVIDTTGTIELKSGSVRGFTPTVTGWDLCAGAPTCPGGTYAVYAQYTKPTLGVLNVLGAIGDNVSDIYSDSIVYTPTTPTPTPAPIPSSSVSPIVSGVPSPTPSVTATPSPSVTPVTSTGPVPSASPTLPAGPISGVPGSAVATAAFAALALSVLPILLSSLALARGGADIFAVMAFALQSFMMATGLKRRPHIWGVVYDVGTKHGIPFAKMELVNEAGRTLETRFADRDGRYGFLSGAESVQQERLVVRIKPTATGYLFPTARITLTATDYMVYDHLYGGEAMTVEPGAFITRNVPMDPQLWRRRRFAELFPFLSMGASTSWLLNLAFWVGLVAVPWAYWKQPTTLNLIMLILFFAVNGFRWLTGLYRPFGIIRDATTGKPVSYALATLTDAAGTRATFSVTDEKGRYFLVAQPGSYTVQAFTPANVTPQRTASTQVTVSKGWTAPHLKL